VNLRPFSGRSLISCSSTSADNELGSISSIRGASDTVIVSFGPATLSLNVNSVAAPISTRTTREISGDMASASARRILARGQQVHRKSSRRIGGRVIADPRLRPDGHDVRVRNRRPLRVQDHASQRARGSILPPSHASRKNKLQEKYAEDNYAKNAMNRNWKSLTAEAHANPLESETPEPEGIPETLSIYISK